MVSLEAVSYILISIIRTCYCYDRKVQKALVCCSGKNPGLNCDLNYDNVSIFKISHSFIMFCTTLNSHRMSHKVPFTEVQNVQSGVSHFSGQKSIRRYFSFNNTGNDCKYVLPVQICMDIFQSALQQTADISIPFLLDRYVFFLLTVNRNSLHNRGVVFILLENRAILYGIMGCATFCTSLLSTFNGEIP